MKRRSISTVLLAAIVLPLVLLIAGVTWSKSYDPFKSLSQSLRGSANPTTSLFVAQDAPISLSLTVNPDRLLSVSSAPLNFGKSKTQEELENLRDSLLGLGTLDYKTNVLPWLGDELTLAVTSRDVDRTLADGRQPGYLLALKTNDAIASRAFLHEFWRVRSAAQQTETYQGSEITYGQVKNGQVKNGQVKNGQVKNAQVKKGQIKNSQVKKSVVQLSDVPFTLASAIVGNQYVLFANSPKVLKNAINNVQVPSLNLQGNDQYQRALEAIDSKDLGILYINLPEFTALTGDDSIVRSLVQLPTVSPITYSTMAMGLRGSRSGLILDTVLVPDDELSSESDRQTVQTKAETKAIQTKSTTLDILEVLPDRSMAVAVGNDLAELWPTLSNTVRGYPALETLQTQALQSLASQLQLNLIQDVFQWVKGDYGFSIAPIKPNQPTQWVFAVKRDGQEIEQGIAKLDKIARDRGLTIGSVKLGDQTVQAWTQLSSSQNTQLTASTIAAHTTIGNYEVFSTSLKMLENLANKSEKTLNQSLDWTSATREIDNRNQGYAYVEWNDVQPLLEKQIPGLRLIEILAQPIVTHLKSLTISVAESSASESSALRNSASIAKGTVVIGLK
ncbi:MAG: DUF3352 domain-containing protein [Cyanobacteria bacterium]|nr:DUF3352 domain-containing protein [Cyanobacteriota bacterium]